MKNALNTGFNFGLTSGIITTLGLIVGLHGTTNSTMVIIGGIFTIAIADAFSDSLGIHICQESDDKTPREVWVSTASTFITKFLFAMTFVVPVLFFDITTALMVSIVWGVLIISAISFRIAKRKKETVWKVVGEHLVITLLVIVATHFIGDWVAVTFV